MIANQKLVKRNFLVIDISLRAADALMRDCDLWRCYEFRVDCAAESSDANEYWIGRSTAMRWFVLLFYISGLFSVRSFIVCLIFKLHSLSRNIWWRLNIFSFSFPIWFIHSSSVDAADLYPSAVTRRKGKRESAKHSLVFSRRNWSWEIIEY